MIADPKPEVLTPHSSQIIFIDHQPQMLFGVQSIDRQALKSNTEARAKTAKVFKIATTIGKSVLSSDSQTINDENAAFDESCAAEPEQSQRSESCARNYQYEADDNRAEMMTYVNLPPQTITYFPLTIWRV